MPTRRSRQETFTFDRPMGLWLWCGGRAPSGLLLIVSPSSPARPKSTSRSLMDAWILDESPGSYRWGEIDRPALRRDDVQLPRSSRALNHMDLWVTRGMPKPPLPHVPGCDVAGVVEAVGEDVTPWPSATRSSSTPACRRSPTSSPSATTVRSAPGFEIFGEHVGRARTYAVAPVPTFGAAPRAFVGGVCRLSAGDADGVPDAPAGASPRAKPSSRRRRLRRVVRCAGDRRHVGATCGHEPQ